MIPIDMEEQYIFAIFFNMLHDITSVMISFSKSVKRWLQILH